MYTACSAAGTRSDAALSRAGAKLDSTAKTEKVAPEAAGGHVGDGHEALALGELDDQLILLAPAAEAMRVSVSAGRSGRSDACQQRSLGECQSGRWGYYSLAEGVGGWASAPRQHMRPRAATLEARGRRGG